MWYRMVLIVLGVCGAGLCQSETEVAPPPPSSPSSTGDADGGIWMSTTPSMPPEIIRQIQELSEKRNSRVVLPPLSGVHRVLVGIPGVLILLIGVYVCRLARDGGGPMRSGICRMLLFSLFSGLSALCIACACAGTLYLHVAAAVCTAGGGFSVSMLLVPQFSLSRRWIMEPEEGQGENV